MSSRKTGTDSTGVFTRPSTRKAIRRNGFTLIELMIVIAIVAIILTLAMPVYSGYMIRSKIGEGLSVANAAVTAASATCVADLTIAPLTNSRAGYNFIADPGEDSYVQNVLISGPCTDPVITITTKNTGASPDPILVLTGTLSPGSATVLWVCSSSSPNSLLPSSCRS